MPPEADAPVRGAGRGGERVALCVGEGQSAIAQQEGPRGADRAAHGAARGCGDLRPGFVQQGFGALRGATAATAAAASTAAGGAEMVALADPDAARSGPSVIVTGPALPDVASITVALFSAGTMSMSVAVVPEIWPVALHAAETTMVSPGSTPPEKLASLGAVWVWFTPT